MEYSDWRAELSESQECQCEGCDTDPCIECGENCHDVSEAKIDDVKYGKGKGWNQPDKKRIDIYHARHSYLKKNPPNVRSDRNKRFSAQNVVFYGHDKVERDRKEKHHASRGVPTRGIKKEIAGKDHSIDLKKEEHILEWGWSDHIKAIQNRRIKNRKAVPYEAMTVKKTDTKQEKGTWVQKPKSSGLFASNQLEGEVIDERLGGKGYKPRKDYAGRRVSGDWENSDRGGGHKWQNRVGKPVEKKSPTYIAHVKNKPPKKEISGKDASIDLKNEGFGSWAQGKLEKGFKKADDFLEKRPRVTKVLDILVGSKGKGKNYPTKADHDKHIQKVKDKNLGENMSDKDFKKLNKDMHDTAKAGGGVSQEKQNQYALELARRRKINKDGTVTTKTNKTIGEEVQGGVSVETYTKGVQFHEVETIDIIKPEPLKPSLKAAEYSDWRVELDK